MPPTAIIGRLTVDVVDYRDPYTRFLRACIVPAVIIMAAGTLMVVYSAQIAVFMALSWSARFAVVWEVAVGAVSSIFTGLWGA